MIGQFFSPESHGSWTMIYRISATTPEEGKICYEVLDEQEAARTRYSEGIVSGVTVRLHCLWIL